MISIVDNREHKVIVSSDIVNISINYSNTVKIFLQSGYSVIISTEDMKEIVSKIESPASR